MSTSTYVLGHADVEVRRLILQGRLYNDYTGSPDCARACGWSPPSRPASSS